MANDTIFALSSAPGKAAVAVVRVSGPQVKTILAATTGGVPEPRKASRRNIRKPGRNEIIDDGIVIFFSGPSSATGEDVAEFHIHGGRAVLQALLVAFSSFDGCRPAEAGEFSLRAFENGKIDLTAAEGIADLVDAETEAQRRQAQRQAGGELARKYDAWRDQIIESQALIESDIDFSDEADVDDQAFQMAHQSIQLLVGDLSTHLNSASRGEIVRSGYRVVIAGPTNAGKSSLLNALAERDVAIVSDQAGTTRDVIEVHLDLAGYPVIVSDTAGMRATRDTVEQEGIRRTIDRASQSDLVLWLRDITTDIEQAAPPPEARRVIEVFNKADLTSNTCAVDGGGRYQISVKTGFGIPELVDRLCDVIREDLTLDDPVVPTNSRHRHYLGDCRQHLETFLSSDHAQLELRAEDLRLAATALGRITGRIDVEDVLDQIFSRFCIGK